jgi:hypothetical protein
MGEKKLNDSFFTHIDGDESNPNGLDKLLNDVKIDPNEELSPPPVCWQIINENGETSTIGTLGNFSLVIGKAKSRKSFFICLAVSATTKNGLVLNRFKGTLKASKCDVLYFDTEQGKYHVQKAVKRVCSLIGDSNPENLQAYGLRKFPPSQRLQLIEHAIYSNDNVGFVVIDGIKDLINSINDEAEATMISSKLLKWTEERNIHIVTVLHQNKGDNNARGHIGSELVNKSETVLSVSKSPENKDISIVEAEYCRDKEPEPFGFEINEFGMPQLSENWQIKTTKKASTIGVDEMMPDQIYALLIQSFAKVEELGYSELVIQMKLAFKSRLKKTIGENKAKEIITYCKNEGWLIQETAKGKYKRGAFDAEE